MNSSPRPYLKVTRLALTQRGIEQDLLVLDVDALDRADALGEVEHLGLAERRRRVPAAVRLPDDRRVEALLDRRPDRERRREVVAVDDEVRAVADADLVDLAEQVVRRRSGRRRPTARARRRCRRAPAARRPPRRRPRRTARRRASRRSRAYGALGMRVRQRHRHVEVVGAGRERALEDRHHEARIDGVEDVGDARARGTSAATSSAREASTRAADEPGVAAEPVDGALGAGRVVVGDDHRARRSRAARRSGRPQLPTPPAPTTRIRIRVASGPGRDRGP